MRFRRTLSLAGAATLLAAGTAAVAADKLKTMDVALPDGSVAHIEYSGEVAPTVTVVPAERRGWAAHEPFAELDRIAYEMRARHRAMMERMEALHYAALKQAARIGDGDGLTLVGELPEGAHVRYFSSTTDARGCTRTVQYSSDGSGAEPTVTRASSGNCEGAFDAAPVPAAAAEPQPRPLDDLDV